MRSHFGVTVLALLLVVSGITACAAPISSSAALALSPTATSTALPSPTATWQATSTPTPIPSPTPVPNQTPTAQPTPTAEQLPAEPTVVPTPVSSAPPEPDGVLRSADVPILMYHYISTAPSAGDRIRYGLSVPPEMFEAQLKLLKDHGYTTITLRELYEYLAVGTPLPQKSIILTFDDGYLDNYTNAFPILQKYGMHGTFFVLTGKADAGDPAYLSWDMIQEMSSAGMDIQLHSRDHLDMRNRPYDWLVFQIIGGRQSIEGHTGKAVIFMAYPSGKYDANVQRFLRATDFWAAVTTAYGSHHVLQDALNWDRVRISGQMRLQDFARLLGVQATAQQMVPQPSATPTAGENSGGLVSLTPTSTRALPKTATPSSTRFRATQAPPDTTPLATLPIQTPFSSPLQTPTIMQSPLATPTP